MSDTPRTDEATECIDVGATGVLRYVSIEFSEQLERENAKLLKLYGDASEAGIAKLAKRDRQLSSIFSRYVPVEEELRRMAVGKLPLPDKEKCLELATRLGMPFGLWPEKLRQQVGECREGAR